jgi:hypothetical protein
VPVPVTPTTYVVDVANLRPAQYVGSRSAIDFPSYVSGFFDGEGCFTVSISPRATLKVGWEVRPSVSVSQNEDRSQVIHRIKGYFECGSIRRDPSDQTVKWEVRSLHQLRQQVLPHFEEWPLLSAKQQDVELFVAVCDRMARRQHLEPEGLIAIVTMARRMNPSGKRRFDPDVITDQLNEMKA